MENWKDVVGYEGVYQVSDQGRIKRVGTYRNQTGKEWESNFILSPGTKENGYKYVQLCKENRVKPKHVHRLVAEAFIDNPNNSPIVNHIDGNKANNNVSNLEWATYTENNVHSIEKLNRASKNKRGSKPVIQFDLQGNFIKEYPSYREALRQTGIMAIDVVCRGERHKGRKQSTAGGFIWKYKEDIT